MATLFKEVNYNLASLIQQIDLGVIGLPDIQRPFVWKDTKVRDLFDSMYKGYPVGYLLFWANAYQEGSKSIGTDTKQKAAQLLIVDGQQRLTSLFAVMKGQQVIRENYDTEKIVIAFKPLEEKFEIPDAAIRRSPEYIQNISDLWSPEINIFTFTHEFIEKLNTSRTLSAEEITQIQQSISRLKNLEHYPFSALELSASINEEQVADVFVRINSQGKKLNTTDFILTLMSVFWEEGRKDLEDFCASARQPSTSIASAFNYLITPDPEQLLRTDMAFGFRRARMKYAYSILRGKDLETEEFSEERRDEQFTKLKAVQQRVLDLTNWHEFLKAVQMAGYFRGDYISSEVNVMYSYALFLIGKYDFQVSLYALKKIISKWFFMSSITARYSSSSESQMETDMGFLREVRDADHFVKTLEKIIEDQFTTDYWNIALPNSLATSSSQSPAQYAYFASLSLLGARGLFSLQKITDVLQSGVRSPKSGLEKHHLFPKAYLHRQGITDQRQTNQIANYALVEWSDNISISDQDPQLYIPKMRERFDHATLQEMYFWHALPDDWQNMEYEEFLEVRRLKMAQVIKTAYRLLDTGSNGDDEGTLIDIKALIEGGESSKLEFKSTLRQNLYTNQHDPKMEQSCLKTIVAFLNSDGGTLVIGLDDSGKALGVSADGFDNEDKFTLHLMNLIRDRIGGQYSLYIDAGFYDFENERIFVVSCHPSHDPAYFRDGTIEKFYVRTGNSTSELTGSQVESYIVKRFRR